MQRNKPQKKKRKFRLLLDSAFPTPSQLPKLCSRAHVAHVVYTLGLSRQTEDEFIYQKTTQEDCCVVTIDNDFKRLIKPGKAGVIMVPPDLSVNQLEKIIIKFISGKNPDDLLGKAIKLFKKQT